MGARSSAGSRSGGSSGKRWVLQAGVAAIEVAKRSEQARCRDNGVAPERGRRRARRIGARAARITRRRGSQQPVLDDREASQRRPTGARDRSRADVDDRGRRCGREQDRALGERGRVGTGRGRSCMRGGRAVAGRRAAIDPAKGGPRRVGFLALAACASIGPVTRVGDARPALDGEQGDERDEQRDQAGSHGQRGDDTTD